MAACGGTETDAEGAKVQGLPSLHSKFKARLGNLAETLYVIVRVSTLNV